MKDPLIKWKYQLNESTEDIIDNSLLVLRRSGYANISPNDLIKAGLDKYILGDHIGQGAYGVVIDIKNMPGYVIKFFYDAVDVDADLNRYKKIENDLFNTKGSVDEMPFISSGRLSKRYYFVLMPKIIPLNKTVFYGKSEVFKTIITMSRRILHDNPNLSFEELARKAFVESFRDFNTFQVKWIAGEEAQHKAKETFKEDIYRHKQTILKILKAAYRASKEWEGTDLHSGNIGFFATRPDTFFFFDM
jgi:hypothetical protein